MFHIYQMYLVTMSARFLHSSDLDGLREGLIWPEGKTSVQCTQAAGVRPGDRAGASRASGARTPGSWDRAGGGEVIRVDFRSKAGPGTSGNTSGSQTER